MTVVVKSWSGPPPGWAQKCNIGIYQEASLHGLRWAIESMHDHKLNRLIFALDDDTFTKVILRPKAWSNFRCQQLELMEKLSKLEWWKLVKEDRASLRMRKLIPLFSWNFEWMAVKIFLGCINARLTPDQKVACSIHVGFKLPETNSGISFCYVPMSSFEVTGLISVPPICSLHKSSTSVP
ncbi:hypothetical protein YC2023_068787 [Brassica napus]